MDKLFGQPRDDPRSGLDLVRISAHRDHPFRFIVTARFGRT
jgi:hypothetical protein